MNFDYDYDRLGENTHVAADKVWEDFSKKELEDFINNPHNFSDFYEGICDLIKKKRPGINTDKDRVTFIIDSMDNNKIPIVGKTISHWIIGNKGERVNPQTNSASRDNMYKLCFALEMDYVETCNFFYKVYLSRPFDCRKIDEAIYLFCFVNEKKYEDYIRIRKRVTGKIIEEENTENTISFISKIEDIKDEKEFVEFVESNMCFFSGSNNTALELCTELIEDVKKIIYDKLEFEEKQKRTPDSNKMLMEGLINKNFRKDGNGNRFVLKDSKFLKIVKENFPQEIVFSHILNRKNVSYDALRKAIIILYFYKCYGNNDSAYEYDDFKKEMDDIFFECGYQPLYYRNPYDWLFLYCATQEDPIDKLWDIIDFAENEE